MDTSTNGHPLPTRGPHPGPDHPPAGARTAPAGGLSTDLRDLISLTFPLVARPRPACLPLTERLAELTALAQRAHSTAAPDAAAHTAATFNKAALIASDVGLDDLARDLCWRHHHLYAPQRPHTAQTARYALEPIVNLARLMIRNGRHNTAHQLLTGLVDAARHHRGMTHDGHRIDFADFTQTGDDHRQLCQWLWSVLLAEGSRALAAAGQWSDALALHQTNHGLGQRLLDGRQVAIITRCLTGDSETARDLIEASHLTQPWEHAVAHCLTLLHLRTSVPGVPIAFGDAATGLADAVERLGAAPGLIVFRTRLTLAARALVQTPHDADPRSTRQVLDTLVAHQTQQTINARDGYAARDILNHQPTLSRGDHARLTGILHDAQLQTGALTPRQRAELLASVTCAEAVVINHE